MNIRISTDPISLHEVSDPELCPCIYEGDCDNGITIYFENEENRQVYLDLDLGTEIVLKGNDTDDYIAEGQVKQKL